MTDTPEVDSLIMQSINDRKAGVDKFALDDLSNLVHLQSELERELYTIEDKVKTLKAEIKKVSTIDIPELMIDTLGFESLTLADGRKLSCKNNYYASITKDNKAEAFAWLEAEGHGDLVKGEIKVKFGSGESDLMSNLEVVLGSEGRNFTSSNSVHPQTLKAFCREQMEAGVQLPASISVHVERESKLK